jgi:hypothetical protein
MKALFIVVLLLFQFLALGQKSDTLHVHRFTDGRLSTISILSDNFWGYAAAYNREGKEIYRSEIRRVGGSSGVTFKHYPSGAVMQASYSSHPDGGIQWYKYYTFFDEHGNITKEEEDSYERMISPSYTITIKDSTQMQHPPAVAPMVVPTKKVQDTIPKVAPKKEIVACASLHQNQVWLVNHSRKTIYVTIEQRGITETHKLKPGSKLEGPKYVSAEVTSPVNHNMRISYHSKNTKHHVDLTTDIVGVEQYETHYFLNFYVQRRKLRN